MTKRLRLLLPLALLALLLTGFSLYDVTYASTGRVRWETQTYVTGSAATEDTDFKHPWLPGGVATWFGQDIWRTHGMVCSWATAGVDDAGTNSVTFSIVHEDGGVDCTCTAAEECDAPANTPFNCICPSGSEAQIGRTVMPDGGQQFPTTYTVQLTSATDCWTNPTNITCSVDLFR